MSVQLENGFTKIANEILDEIARIKLNGTQFRILMAVFRYTYGFNRKSAELSVSFLAEATNIQERHLRKELERLIQGNVLIEYKQPTRTRSREIGFNKHFDQWFNNTSGVNAPEVQTLHTGVQQIDHSGVQQLDLTGVQQLHPQEIKLKENNKENLNKDICHEIFEHWNNQKIIAHRSLTDKIESLIKKALKDTTSDEIKKAISRYAKMLRDDKCEWCDYPWGLDTFLKREKGYKYFLDTGEKWIAYQRQLAKRGPTDISKPRASPSQEFFVSKEELAALTGGG